MIFRNYIKKNKDTLKTCLVFYSLLIVCTLLVIKCNENRIEKNSITVQENAISITK